MGPMGRAPLSAHPAAGSRPRRDVGWRRPAADRAENLLYLGVTAVVLSDRRRLDSSVGAQSKEFLPTCVFSVTTPARPAPEILAALAEANHGLVTAYGNDPWTTRLDECLSTYFGTSVRAFPVATGTAANCLSLATLTPSYGLIFAHEEAHIANDEAGAPGFFTGGAQLSLLQSPDGKLTREGLAQVLDAQQVSVHTLQPKALALSQATELGTSYRPQELRELCQLAHHHGLKVQMDGARFANAVAFLDCHPGMSPGARVR